MTKEELYDKFLKMWKSITLLGHTTDLLDWDRETFMPKGESETRAEQMAMLAEMIHQKITDDRLFDILSDLVLLDFKGNFHLSIYERANICEAMRAVKLAKALPADLVVALAKETSLASKIWQEAREKNSFNDFAPALAKIISLSREKAAAYMAAGIGTSPYEALFFEYEDGISLAEVDAIFDKLRAELPPLVKTVMLFEPPNDSFLSKHYPKEFQEKFSREIITAMGLDWNRCRIDTSTHPFTCSPAYGSPRITTRYDENNLIDALFSAIHEAGHALYEQGLPQEFAYQPIGAACSLSVHESQSRFWEAWLGRSYPFWAIFFRKLYSTFPKQLSGVTDKAFYRAVNRANIGFIRTDSNPLTYNLHILLRKDIEKAMIDNACAIDDLPAFWNELFKKYFGIEVPDDRRGILQDVHWSCGLIGYFPTYTLGNIISAQLYKEIENEIPWSSMFENGGSCHAFRKWLLEKIHSHGSLYKTQELVKIATGQSISADVFMVQLKERYSDVYNTNLL